MALTSVNDFRTLIKWLDTSHRPYLNDLTEAHSAVFNDLLAILPWASDREIEILLPSAGRLNCDFIRDRKFLYLSPNPGGSADTKLPFLPVLAIKCDFGTASPKIRMGVALAQRHKTSLRILGLRFEAPEGLGGGLHDFYHAQLIQAFVSDHVSVPLNPPTVDLTWIPTTQPSMPLDARCPITLTLALLVSLYGFRYLEVVSQDSSLPQHYFEEMRCWEMQPRYHCVTGGGSAHFVKCRIADGRRVKEMLKSKLGLKGSLKVENSSRSQYDGAHSDRQHEFWV